MGQVKTERPIRILCSACRVESAAEGWTQYIVAYRVKMRRSGAWEYDTHLVLLRDTGREAGETKRAANVLSQKYAPTRLEILSLRPTSLQTMDWEGRLDA